ncbi:unnamed protein product [Rhizopus stolonifer]
MSVIYQSPTKNWNESEYNNVLSYSANKDHYNLCPTQEFINEIQQKRNFTPTTHRSNETLDAMPSRDLNQLLINTARLLLIDVRSNTHYSKDHIRSSIHIAIPSILLKRPNYTLDKVTESFKDKDSAHDFEQWPSATHIVFYDHTSSDLGSSVTAVLLAKKFKETGYRGSLTFLKGGFEEFRREFPDQCFLKPTTEEPKPSTPFFFFNNIRQNLELSHGPLKERFAIRMPSGKKNQIGIIPLSASPTHPPRYGFGGSSIDSLGNFVLPIWLKDMMMADKGPKRLAESYEYLERMEQERLDFVMRYHSSHKSTDFPLSIASSMEKGILNRYNNIWPFEYSRVKLSEKKDDYINANYLQYAVSKNQVLSPTPALSNKEKEMIQSGLLSQDSLETMCYPEQVEKDRKYIATQGPLPTTMNDFWKMVWDQESDVIVMLTNEEELQKNKCHLYWPQTEQNYGPIMVQSISEEEVHPVMNINDKRDRKEQIIVRRFKLKHRSSLLPDRVLTHLQYTGWSDFGVPDSPIGLLQLIYLANESYGQGPLVVHCSAGCGRTGTFCVVDTVIQRLWQERDVYTCSTVDKVKETVSRLREQRMSTVQTHRQYVFCYEAILWWLLGYGHLPGLNQNMDHDV